MNPFHVVVCNFILSYYTSSVIMSHDDQRIQIMSAFALLNPRKAALTHREAAFD